MLISILISYIIILIFIILIFKNIIIIFIYYSYISKYKNTAEYSALN